MPAGRRPKISRVEAMLQTPPSRWKPETHVRAVVYHPGRRALGRVSEVGGASLWVETHQPLPLGVQIELRVVSPDGGAIEQPARVGRKKAGGFGVVISEGLDAEEWGQALRTPGVEVHITLASSKPPRTPLLASAGTLARGRPRPFGAFRGDPRSPPPRAVSLKPGPKPVTDEPEALWDHWRTSQESLRDDGVQQAFIQRCLEAQNLGFALARYRELKAQMPEAPEPEKYLRQIGLLIGFSGMDAQQRDALNVRSRKLRVLMWGLTLVLLGAGALTWGTVGMGGIEKARAELQDRN